VLREDASSVTPQDIILWQYATMGTILKKPPPALTSDDLNVNEDNVLSIGAIEYKFVMEK